MEVFRVQQAQLLRADNGWVVIVESERGGGAYVVPDAKPRESTDERLEFHEAAAEAGLALQSGIEAWVKDCAHQAR